MPNEKGIRIFSGAVAVITGAASGIGRALSEELAGRGCEVILADLQDELAGEVAEVIRKKGGKAEALRIDVRNFAEVEGVVKDTFNRCGRLDYMFNNAGIGVAGDTHLHIAESWHRIIEINIKGVANGVQAAYPLMYEQGFGHIVNTASMAGLISIPSMAAYTATKHAVVGLSKSLRVEAAIAGIRVSVLCPGVIRTPILEGGKLGVIHGVSEDEIKKIWDFPFFRPMEPDIFARKVIDDVAKNRPIIIVPRWCRYFWWQSRIIPSSVQFALDRLGYLYLKAKATSGNS